MPTLRPRHMLTETPEVAAALDLAARQWPELANDRAALARRLVAVGGETVGSTLDKKHANRLARIREGAGAATGVFPPDALAGLRADWPE